jgi:hypothetical protein
MQCKEPSVRTGGTREPTEELKTLSAVFSSLSVESSSSMFRLYLNEV